MKNIVFGLATIWTRKDSRLVLISSLIFFIVALLLFQNGRSALDVYGFDALPMGKRVSLAATTLFDVVHTFSVSSFILSLFGSVIGAINISLAYTYVRVRGSVIFRSGLYSGIGLLFAFLGIGCAACGTAVISIAFTFLGLGGLLNLLPYHGQEIGYVGLLVLTFASYTLCKRVSSPNVC